MRLWIPISALAVSLGTPVIPLAHASVHRSPDVTDPPVTVVEDASSFTLANGCVTARVDKRAGTFSLNYRGLDVVERGYWSQVGRSEAGAIAQLGTQRSAAIRTDPAKNGGARAEVSCRFGYDGHSAGLPCDVELRYALGRGDHGLYAYAVWEHRPGYPGFSVGEARMACKLNPAVFDFLTVDANRRTAMPSGYDWDRGIQLNMKEVRRITTGPHAGKVEHKYDYSAILADTPAYGWSSTKQHVGVWMINPSIEYLAGGPTKVELTGHLDGNPGGLPTLLNMWHGSHYGGSSLVVARQEAWTKLIGPFLLYCNAAPNPKQMWHDALAKDRAEQQTWPYPWVHDPNYPPASERGTVTGTLTISDPQAPGLKARNVQVGLAAPPYTPPSLSALTQFGSVALRGSPCLRVDSDFAFSRPFALSRSPAASQPQAQTVDWQRDSKHYQFWTRVDDRGRFTLRDVRPGTYTLYAFADGVLGEFRMAPVTVAAGQTAQLGHLVWIPVRYGRQLWEIGIPNRSAEEFRHGDHYWQWGLYYQYPKEFPHDVQFIIGKSDWRRDWNYCQPPRIEGDRIRSTTWSIIFTLPQAPGTRLRVGRAILRLAIAGSRAPHGIEVTVNDTPAGGTGPLPDTGVMHRDGIRGYWCERDVSFDAALLKPGANTIKLTVPATHWVQGVLYDYLRLELDAAARPAGGNEAETGCPGGSDRHSEPHDAPPVLSLRDTSVARARQRREGKLPRTGK